MPESAHGLPSHLGALSTLQIPQPQGPMCCVSTTAQVMKPLSDLREAVAPDLLGQSWKMTVQKLVGRF